MAWAEALLRSVNWWHIVMHDWMLARCWMVAMIPQGACWRCTWALLPSTALLDSARRRGNTTTDGGSLPILYNLLIDVLIEESDRSSIYWRWVQAFLKIRLFMGKLCYRLSLLPSMPLYTAAIWPDTLNLGYKMWPRKAKTNSLWSLTAKFDDICSTLISTPRL